MGQRDYSIRAWLDPQKLAARNMTAMDVASAIRSQNLDAPAGQIGQPPAAAGQSFQLPIDTLGRLTDPEQFGDIIVKVGPATPPSSRPSAHGTPSGGARRRRRHGRARRPPPSGQLLAADGQMQIDTTVVDPITQARRAAAVMRPAGERHRADHRARPRRRRHRRRRPRPAAGGARPAAAASITAVARRRRRNQRRRRHDRRRSDDRHRRSASAAPRRAGDDRQRADRAARRRGRAARASPATGIVRLRDVARVELGAQNYNQSCTFDGQPSVGLARLPASRHQRARRRRPRASQDGGAEDALSRRRRLRHRLRHHAVSSASRSPTSSRRCSKPWSWSASSCWSSCRTGGP